MSKAWNGSGCFNPRSYERSDAGCKGKDTCQHSFNPRSYERSDKGSVLVPVEFYSVSIHAPTKGATQKTNRV